VRAGAAEPALTGSATGSRVALGRAVGRGDRHRAWAQPGGGRCPGLPGREPAPRAPRRASDRRRGPAMSGRDGLLPETRLGRAWDARNAGQAASPNAEVDPALTVVRHLHERDDAHGPDPAFVRDLRARFAHPSAAHLTARLQ